MKNTMYLKSIFILLIISLFSCKQVSDSEFKESEKIPKEKLSAVNDLLDQKKPKHFINDFQGIWESFSEYLEHESEFKDYNENKYYKIIYGKNTLDIIIASQPINSVDIYSGYIGFMDNYDSISSLNEEVLIKHLKESGNLLTRFKKGLKNYNPEDIESSTTFSRHFDVTEILDDGLSYNKKNEKISFRLISSLPKEVFETLKVNSKKEGIEYINDYNIKKYSEKIKVTSEKTFFHTEMTTESKRKAFLVKGDIAYLEDSNDDWVKVYYDGKIVSEGYVKRADVEVLK